MTCYEHLRKKPEKENKDYDRLQSYFHAIEQNKVKEYHDKHGRRLDEF